MLVGYARVSTSDQDTALQLDALKRAKVRLVFHEQGSGVGPRPQLHAAVQRLKAGDTLVVWKLDRIARSLPDLLAIIDAVKRQGAMIRSLTEPIDTTNPIGEFTLQVLGAVAQLERSMIRERVMAGQAAARARGKRWGPSRALPADVESALVSRYLEGGVTQREVADSFGVSFGVARGAIYRVTRPDAPYLTRRR